MCLKQSKIFLYYSLSVLIFHFYFYCTFKILLLVFFPPPNIVLREENSPCSFISSPPLTHISSSSHFSPWFTYSQVYFSLLSAYQLFLVSFCSNICITDSLHFPVSPPILYSFPVIPFSIYKTSPAIDRTIFPLPISFFSYHTAEDLNFLPVFSVSRLLPTLALLIHRLSGH